MSLKLSRGLALVAVLVGALFTVTPAASADPTYPVPGPKITVTVTKVKPGGTVTVHACGYVGATQVNSQDKYQGQSTTGSSPMVGANGCVDVAFVLSSRGYHMLTVIGTDAAALGRRGTAAPAGPLLVQSVGVTVAAAPAAAVGSGLPRTGGTLAPLWAGAALLLAGGGLVAVTRGRRRRHAY